MSVSAESARAVLTLDDFHQLDCELNELSTAISTHLCPCNVTILSFPANIVVIAHPVRIVSSASTTMFFSFPMNHTGNILIEFWFLGNKSALFGLIDMR